MFKKFRKSVAPMIAKAAAKEAPAPAVKAIGPMAQKAQALAPAVAPAVASKAAPPSAPTGGSGRGFFGKVQQAARQIRPALKEAAPAIKKNLETNPAKAVAGGARGIGRQIVKKLGRGLGGIGFKEGGSVSSGRGNGIAVRGKTKCKMS